MPENNSIKSNSLKSELQNNELAQLRKVILLVVRNWYYFVIALVLSITIAYLYNRYTLPTYRVNATLLIEGEKESTSTSGDQILEGFGLTGSMKNLDNQIMILSSRQLIGSAISELILEKEYYYRKLSKIKSFYPGQPIEIVPISHDNFPKDVEFVFKFRGDNSFKLDTEPGATFDLHTSALFGETIEYEGVRFYINLLDREWFTNRKNRKIYFIWHSHDKLVDDFSDRLIIEPASKNGTAVNIKLDGTNKIMDTDFLNQYLELFLNMSLDKKNIKAIRTIQFIDDMLIGISDSLILTEDKLQQFRSRHRVMDLSAQGQSIIDQAVVLENEQARRGIEAEYYNYLSEYLTENDTAEVPIAPATIGITDPGLTKLVADLADLQGQYYSKSLGEKNPMQTMLAQRIENTKNALEETLKGVIRANNLAIADINAQIRNLNAQASALPVTERELLGIERKYQLNNELYTYLLEKRAQAQIQKASNVPDNEIIDPPRAESIPLRPRGALNYMLAMFTGFGLPFLLILLIDAISLKIKDTDEIQRTTNIPVSGHIPHYSQKKNVLILDESESHIAEAFRSLRTRLQFFTKEVISPVILVTSPMPGDGKTSIACNLAYAYSLLEQKTVIIDFDLRAPKINSVFNLNNKVGISKWLIGKDKFEDIIKQTKYKNLDIISAGPVPPNPSELASLFKTNDLLNKLKERYDYIIIDSSPIGIFSDAIHLASLADASLIVIRQNQTLKNILNNTITEININTINSVSFVLNDLTLKNYNYGYAKRYRYAVKK